MRCVAHVNRAHSSAGLPVYTSNRSDCRRARKPIVCRRRTAVGCYYYSRVGLINREGSCGGGGGLSAIARVCEHSLILVAADSHGRVADSQGAGGSFVDVATIAQVRKRTAAVSAHLPLHSRRGSAAGRCGECGARVSGCLVTLLGLVVTVGGVQVCAFSASKIAAHAVFPPEGFLVADPAPVVEPADVFMPQPAPPFALLSPMSPYSSLRAPGAVAVVNNPVATAPGLEANITIAALAVALVIAVTPVGFFHSSFPSPDGIGPWRNVERPRNSVHAWNAALRPGQHSMLSR